MQGTPFRFQCPSIVNPFLRRTVFSPNTEIFPVRPNKLTRYVFKTKVQDKCRVDNNATAYIHIHQFKETSQQRIDKTQKITRCDSDNLQLTPHRRRGKNYRKSLQGKEN
jgi:hypothetical protein